MVAGLKALDGPVHGPSYCSLSGILATELSGRSTGQSGVPEANG
jgi:hypothetical protein